jgi:hypothetical protein
VGGVNDDVIDRLIAWLLSDAIDWEAVEANDDWSD